ncbi:hypothetical protein F1847_02705 [Thermodesulfobacterium sp. TA1]|uniref:hypothetical protein n=1 Tax=Thermodesulfobacterium sp. TA1 TaxID=2234087 RepID=UPI001231A0A0|nr:hypothetical protein [Thermodesulfobacterium sp. TA1]QER41710.1 hypothetical protein F1847_02705 [Thermodesulfobacterium sp. TA1]
MVIRQEVLQEVEFILYEGGEIPEVCFWNCFFYLTSPPPEGLGLSLTQEELKALKKSVIERYLVIIERDLTAEFIAKPFYRGISRAAVNVRRLKNFIKNSGLEEEFKDGVLRRKLKRLLKRFEADLKRLGLGLEKVATKEELREFKREVERL